MSHVSKLSASVSRFTLKVVLVLALGATVTVASVDTAGVAGRRSVDERFSVAGRLSVDEGSARRLSVDEGSARRLSVAKDCTVIEDKKQCKKLKKKKEKICVWKKGSCAPKCKINTKKGKCKKIPGCKWSKAKEKCRDAPSTSCASVTKEKKCKKEGACLWTGTKEAGACQLWCYADEHQTKKTCPPTECRWKKNKNKCVAPKATTTSTTAAPSASPSASPTPKPTPEPTPEPNAELRAAVGEWFADADAAAAKYGPMGAWDTSRVSYMSGLFGCSQTCTLPYLIFNEDLGAWVGAAGAAVSVGQLLSSYAWGALSDRIGRRPVMLMGMCNSTFSVLVFGTARSYAQCLAGRFLSGLLNLSLIHI